MVKRLVRFSLRKDRWEMFALLLQKVKQQFEDPIAALRKRGVVVGERVAIQSGAMIDYSHGWHIEIGDDVTLAPRVHILGL